MKVSREQAAANRERIVEVAAKLFREHGFDGIGVADIMKGADLTHGGFYGHFGSKDDLAAEACARALDASVKRWDAVIESNADPLAAITESYLSPRHRDHPGDGCLIAALGPDVARQHKSVRHAVTAGLHALADRLAGLMPGSSKATKRRKALARFAAMVGAVAMARAVDDRALSEEILHAVAASLRDELH
jgi:TetR/AcrR family transcriptional regulator, transcriptional repressor for nem operon